MVLTHYKCYFIIHPRLHFVQTRTRGGTVWIIADSLGMKRVFMDLSEYEDSTWHNTESHLFDYGLALEKDKNLKVDSFWVSFKVDSIYTQKYIKYKKGPIIKKIRYYKRY